MIDGTKVRVRQKKWEDARSDYNWHTDVELSDLDAVAPLRMSFSSYLQEYDEQLSHPLPHRKNYAIETLAGKHIGNCVYYNIDEENREAEVGIMIGDREYWNQGYGTDAMTTLVKYIFQNTDFKRLYLKTLEKNLRAQHSFIKCGFKPYGYLERDGYHFLLMELPRTQWQEQNDVQQKNSKRFKPPDYDTVPRKR